VASDRPLVAGDASALPFKTGAFDILISSHLIEHLQNPDSFFREAGRVANGGLFIAPSALLEQLWSTSAHLWLVEHEERVLRFIPKNQPICNQLIANFFETEVKSNLLRADNFLLDYRESLEIDYMWTGHPQCIVEGKPFTSDFVQASTAAETATVSHIRRGSERLRALLRKWVRVAAHALLSSHSRVDWVKILACPKCHGDVSISLNQVLCSACELGFPVENGIPIMLLDHAVASPSS
jgi:uncharacterized protein YbaR (Trm112 family)/SAM-dependent methyltransferase